MRSLLDFDDLPGEFDFSDEALKDSLRLNVKALFGFNWKLPTGPPV
jgi:hypothetical protein